MQEDTFEDHVRHDIGLIIRKYRAVNEQVKANERQIAELRAQFNQQQHQILLLQQQQEYQREQPLRPQPQEISSDDDGHAEEGEREGADIREDDEAVPNVPRRVIVAITGKFIKNQREMGQLIESKGFVYAPVVTRGCTYLIAHPVNHQSQKVDHAGEYGTPIHDAHFLANLLGVDLEEII